MTWELRVALRYLTARRKQAFISLISGVAVVGVAVGVMAVLIAIGLMTGLQTEIRTRILGATAHVSIFQGRGDPFAGYQAVLEQVRTVPGVAGAAPALYGKVLVTSSTGSAFATLKGIVSADEATVTDVVSQIQEGDVAPLEEPGEGPAPVLLGYAMAETLNVGVGDVVTVTSPKGRLSPIGVLPRVKKVRVAGTVKTGLFEFDSSWAYMSLEAAQRLFDQRGQVTLVEVRLDDMFAVRDGAAAILERLGHGYLTTDWIQTNGRLFAALWLEKMGIGLAIGLIVAVAALNIVATLLLMVMEKHKDIAILVSMGASQGAITRVFVLQGSIIGVVGTTVGGVLGSLACWAFDHFDVFSIPEDVYQIAALPFLLLPGDATVVIVSALLICFLATIYPARAAARVDPAEALRYE